MEINPCGKNTVLSEQKKKTKKLKKKKKKKTKKLKKTKQKNVTIFSQVFKIQKDLGSKSILRDKFWI